MARRALSRFGLLMLVAFATSACVSTARYSLPPGDSVEVRVVPAIQRGTAQLQIFQDGLTCTRPGILSASGVENSVTAPFTTRLPASGIQTAWFQVRDGGAVCNVAISFEPRVKRLYEIRLGMQANQCTLGLRDMSNPALPLPEVSILKRTLTANQTCTPITKAEFDKNAQTRRAMLADILAGRLPGIINQNRTDSMLKDLEGLIGK